MDSAHWPQVVVKSMEEEEGRRPVSERRAKPAKDQILNCPRCNSNNTKFCYYNNYSLSQPRYFCKSCRRYWTAGGSLRNIPVGGASRKNKRPALSPAPSTSSSAKKNDAQPPPNPIINASSPSNINTTSSPCWTLSDHMDQMLKTGMSPRELIPFMPMPAPQPSSMCSTAADCDPSSRNINGFEGAAGEARSLLTVEEFKQLPSIIADQNGGKLGDVAGFWNGIFGGGSW